MTAHELVQKLTEKLSAAGVENAEGEARYIAEDALDAGMTWFFLNGNKELVCEEKAADGSMVKTAQGLAIDRAWEFAERRCQGEPIQYILGHTNFMGLDIKVAPGVLIPRPETEFLCGLASTALEELVEARSSEAGKSTESESPADDSFHILDLCTGSGCIAACMQDDFPDAKVYAADISEEALAIAKQNVPESVTLLQGDLFGALDGLDGAEQNGSNSNGSGKNPDSAGKNIKFDIIISNPPYIPSRVVDGLSTEVKDHEPRLALDGGEEGMDLIEKIIVEAADWLTTGGLLYMETDETQRSLLLETCEKCGRYSEFEVIKDLAGKDRYLRAKL